jgi:nucleotide-binding universal stress UspA family protein
MPRAPEVEVTAPPSPPAAETAGGILVATDGTHDADGAARVGIALAQRDGLGIGLLSVVEPLPLYDTDGVAASDVEQLTSVSLESRQAAVRAQRERTHPGAVDWPCTIEVGGRVDRIMANADRTGTALIVLGLGAHGVAARLFQRETALRVIRAAKTPVLAVPADARGVPHSALAALDFTASSEHAARAALALLGGEGTLYLAHVTPRVQIPQGDSRTWEEVAMAGALPRMEAVARRLDPPPGVQVEYVSLQGEPARELLAFAEEYGVDVVAAGAHGRSAFGRLVLGSVSTALVRAARCGVLVAPPASGAV